MDQPTTTTEGTDTSSTAPIRDIAAAARRTLGDAAAAIPDAVEGSRAALDDAATSLRDQPDSHLLAGAAFATGAGLGLLVGGAPRLVALLAFAPALLLVVALFDRRPTSRSRGA
jgi:hypothetical protein